MLESNDRDGGDAGVSISSSPQISRSGGGSSNIVILTSTRGSSAKVNFTTAQVISWKHNSCGQELLFTSSKLVGVEHGKLIRGGIRVCFPKIVSPMQIDDHGPIRNMVWSIDSNPPPFPDNNTSQNAMVDLILKSMEGWNNSCEFRLRVILGVNGDLTMTSRIMNTNVDGRPFKFLFAYQNHIRVEDVTDVRIEGLETLDYIDMSAENEERNTEQDDSVTFESEVDRIYLSTPTKIATIDHGSRFTIVLHKDCGLPDAIVWNPMDKMVKAMPGLGIKDYSNFVVVGAAAFEKQIILKPGEEWSCKQILSYYPTSYNNGENDD